MYDDWIFTWKNSTFTLGLTLLLMGAVADIAPDWDIPVTVIMASLTYKTAERSADSILRLKWKSLPRTLFDTWFAVDGAYVIYWFFVDRSALIMRDIQWPVSLCLYFMCGFIWLLNESESLSDTTKSGRHLSH
ncbi:hypothetical protein UFOVP580_7 [uncultured Caudovirales phage]|uniref:Uncharacterized protein n=1 Tax=uncultured Caudovirales phage TaxID=2100421 RepID=A0A6J5PFH6_9CAUD|nr:hypothetical protein UFOVP580_7 [uncultured Caudovirales phage]